MPDAALPTFKRDELRPLVVDFDGALIRNHLWIEILLSRLSTEPRSWLSTILELSRNHERFDPNLLQTLDFKALPLDEELLDLLRLEKSRGRRIFLVSNADHKLVEPFTGMLDLFDEVITPKNSAAATVATKAEALCQRFGQKEFDYIGGSLLDCSVWNKAADVLVVGTSSLLSNVRTQFPKAKLFVRRRVRPIEYVRAVRPHQWLKNLLIFAPAIAAHDLGVQTLVPLATAFLSFSFAASSAYVLNDLLDLSHDRAHSSKKNRPLASGALPIRDGVILLLALFVGALVIALLLSWRFAACLGAYVALTVLYSAWIKRHAIADVITLACLYGLRLLAGSVVVSVPLSFLFVTFSLFLFLCLAIAKRCAELVSNIALNRDDLSGRGYRTNDLPLLDSMATASGYGAVLVLSLYVGSPQVIGLYRIPELLWLICILLTYWISRMLLLTRRGLMNDDPIVFAATDGMSVICLIASAFILFVASV